MRELVAVADRRLADAEALGDVRLRERRRDAIRIGMAAQRDQEVFPPRGGEGLGKSARAVLLRKWQPTDRLGVHG